MNDCKIEVDVRNDLDDPLERCVMELNEDAKVTYPQSRTNPDSSIHFPPSMDLDLACIYIILDGQMGPFLS